ncbi:MAG: MYG1 family protein [Patescibacteria group bacterium]|nr:MYG1 family protein [Patescibacteria group bacterium]
MTKSITIVTHSGNFHADDEFAVATLCLHIKKKVRIIRTRDPHLFASADYVVDVGTVYNQKKNRFDHHQRGGGGIRKNKIPYASFGLVWKKFGARICASVKTAEIIEKRIVESVDAIDNGAFFFKANGEIRPYLVDDFIQAFCPTWKETKYSTDKAFLYLVGIAKELLKREVIRVKNKQHGLRIVEGIYKKTKDKRFLVMNKHYPYKDALAKRKTLFVVRPEMGNLTWRVEAVPETAHSFVSKKLFPKKWAGKRDKELALISGVSDAVFCHNNRFIAVAKSKEGAIALARLALAN